MRAIVEILPGVGLCVVLALTGDVLAVRAGLAVPGAVLGLLVYVLWLASGRAIGWSRPGAALLLRWIGAMLVPALVGLQAYAARLAGALLPLALLLLVTTLVTALATALCFRLAGGRG